MTTIQNLNFNPTSISGCQLWLDAADPFSLTLSGANVTQWNDKSGSNYNATASGASPLVANRLNGLPGIQFTGTNSFSGTASNTGTTVSVFIVAEMSASTGSYGRIVSLGTAATDDFNSTARTAAILRQLTNQAITSYRNSELGVVSVTYNTPFIGGSFYTGSINIMYSNGTAGTSVASSGSFNYSLYAIGTNAGLGPVNLVGYVYEVLIYNTSVTNTQREQVEGYLAWKWGLQANLPSNHPYRNVAPNSAGLVYPTGFSPSVPRQAFQLTSFPLVFFNPMSISGLQFWLNAADSSSLTLSNTTVTSWRDRSANGLILNAARNALPVVGTAINTLNTVNFSSTAGLGQTLIRLDGTKNFYWVGRRGSNSDLIYLMGDETNFDWTGGTNSFIDTSFSQTGLRAASPAVVYAGNSNISSNFSGLNAPAVGTIFFLSVTGITGSTRFQGICYDRTGGRGYRGDVGEVLTYSNALTTAQHQQVEGYLAWKWGLQTCLASNHPYRNAVPGPSAIPIRTISMIPVSFSPKNISGISLWLDAADSSTITSSGSNISGWTDKSGTSRTVTFSGSSNTYSSSSNSVSTSLPGNSYFYANVDNRKSTVPNLTIFTVHQWNSSATNSNQGLWGNDDGGGWNRIQLLSYPSVPAYSYGLSYSTSSPFLITVSGLNTSNRVLYNANYALNVTNGTFANINGSLATSLVTEGSASPQTTTTNTYFGTWNSTGTLASIAFNEIIMYSVTLTTAQRQQVEGYLAWKWGLQGSLPANHPFKNFLPPPN